VKIFRVLVVLAIAMLQLRAEWCWQNPLPQGNLLMSVDFTDDLHGWAVGYCGTILKTDDGGVH